MFATRTTEGRERLEDAKSWVAAATQPLFVA